MTLAERDLRQYFRSPNAHQRPQEQHNPEPQERAADNQKAHEGQWMNPEQAEDLDYEPDDQQNSCSTQTRVEPDRQVRSYSGFHNFTSLKWVVL